MDKKYEKKYSENGFWNFIKKYAGKFPLVRETVAMFYCMKDPLTPFHIKATILGSLGYLVSPLDAVPDPIPGLGLLDDMAVIGSTIALICSHFRQEHWDAADELLGLKPEPAESEAV